MDDVMMMRDLNYIDNSPNLVILIAVIYTRIMFCLHEIV